MEGIFTFFTETFNSFLWQKILLPCVLVGGIVFTVQSGFLQIVHFKTALGVTLGQLFRKKEREEGSLSPLEALCTALAGTVGTGSVVGTCQALALGGPGALFWLVVSAFFGMIIKFYEVVLAVASRRRNGDGEWLGGPMYYMEAFLGKWGKPLGALFCVFALLASFGMGNLAQSNGVFRGTVLAFSGFVSLSSEKEGIVALILALLLAAVLAAALFGGAKRVGKVCSFVVPAMSLFYVFLAGVVILFHHERLWESMKLVLTSAFSPRALAGAGTGIGVKCALEWGLKRSAFSNEAGLGSAAIAHANAQTPNPVTQGFFGIFEVFVDTLVICTLTGFGVLVSLPPERILSYPYPDATLISEAFSTVFPASFSSLFVGGSLALFAFSTLLGWSLYGGRCARYLFGKKGEKPYRILFVFLAVLGIFFPMTQIWALSDTFNALMALPNFLALFLLSGKVKHQVKDYFQTHPRPRTKNN